MTRSIIAIIALVSLSWTGVPEGQLYENYRKAIKNESTFQYFLVIHLTDLNAGQTREICTQGNFLQGAIHREYNLGYADHSIKKVEKLVLANRTRTFTFRNVEAIQNLGTNQYTMEDLREFEEKNNIDQLIKEIHKDWTKRLDDKEMLLYAHALFNRGILTGENSCYGGTLEVVSK